MTVHLLGSGTERSQGRLGGFKKFNYAPSLAEAVSIAAGGVPEGLRGASVVTPFYESDFSSGVDGWVPVGSSITLTGNVDGIGGEDNWARIVRTGPSGGMSVQRPVTIAAGKKRTLVRLFNPIGSPITHVRVASLSDIIGAVASVVVAVPTNTQVDAVLNFESTQNAAISIIPCLSDGALATLANGTTIYFKNVVHFKKGLTSQLTPESIQLAPGQWLDTSGNGKHAYVPDGFRLGAASRSGDLSSVLTWEASSTDPRYVAGVNASAVPADSAITLYAKASSAGTFDIGDGSNATYYESAVSIGTDWAPITLTNVVNDGTNRKIVLTPTSAYEGSATISAQVQVLA